jgi:hypothetical protein
MAALMVPLLTATLLTVVGSGSRRSATASVPCPGHPVHVAFPVIMAVVGRPAARAFGLACPPGEH